MDIELDRDYEFLEDDSDEMDMPCPCQICGKIFDLNNGVACENIVYCEECGMALKTTAEKKEELEDAEHELTNLKWDRNDLNRQIEELEEKIKNLKAEL